LYHGIRYTAAKSKAGKHDDGGFHSSTSGAGGSGIQPPDRRASYQNPLP
jgi:hypothetical protein